MHGISRAAVRTLAAAVVLAACVACGPAGNDGGDDGDGGGGGGGGQRPFPAGAGIQQALSLSALEVGGWIVCFEDAYADTGASIPAILSTCVGPYVMLACRPSATSDLLSLAAADARSVVLQADDASGTAHHVSNGVGWYFTDTMSWGFFPAAEGVTRAPCDAGSTASEQRLCWHAKDAELDRGYRCGTMHLPAASGWRRMVLVHP